MVYFGNSLDKKRQSHLCLARETPTTIPSGGAEVSRDHHMYHLFIASRPNMKHSKLQTRVFQPFTTEPQQRRNMTRIVNINHQHRDHPYLAVASCELVVISMASCTDLMSASRVRWSTGSTDWMSIEVTAKLFCGKSNRSRTLLFSSKPNTDERMMRDEFCNESRDNFHHLLNPGDVKRNTYHRIEAADAKRDQLFWRCSLFCI